MEPRDFKEEFLLVITPKCPLLCSDSVLLGHFMSAYGVGEMGGAGAVFVSAVGAALKLEKQLMNGHYSDTAGAHLLNGLVPSDLRTIKALLRYSFKDTQQYKDFTDQEREVMSPGSHERLLAWAAKTD